MEGKMQISKLILILLLFSGCAKSQPPHVVIHKDKATVPQGIKLYLNEGNSIPNGATCCYFNDNPGFAVWTGLNGQGNYTYHNVALDGSAIAAHTTDILGQLVPFFDDDAWDQIIVSELEGTNQISATGNGATAFADMMTYRDSLLAQDTRVHLAIYTMPSCTPTYLDTAQRTIYNNLLLASTQTTRYKVIDLTTIPEISASTAYSNTTYFAVDGVHLSATGQALMSAKAITVIRTF